MTVEINNKSLLDGIQIIQAGIDRKKKEIADLIVTITNLKSDIKIECVSPNNFEKGCGELTKVKELIYIQTEYYVRPSGCNDGDYWNAGEGRFKCIKCGFINRLYNRADIVTLKDNFKSITAEQIKNW